MKKVLFVLTLFSVIGFFNPVQIFSPQLTKLIFYLLVCISAVYAILYGKSLRDTDYPRKFYWLFMLFVCLSPIPATAFHMQSFSVSVMTTLPYIFSYFYFWILLRMDLPKEFVLKCLFIACLLCIPVYFINLFSFPNVVFGEEIVGDFQRGILRVPIVFLDFIVMFLFYGVEKILYKQGNRNYWIAICSVCMLMIFLSVIRQTILYSLVLSLLFLLKRVSIFKKILMVLSCVLVVYFVLPEIPAYNAMLEISQEQIDDNEEEENVRIRAYRYYTYENQTNEITPYVGNGVPSFGNSVWGSVFEDEVSANKYYYADIAWGGTVYLFGWIATAALFILILAAIIKHKSIKSEYLTYWFIYILLTGFGTGVFIYYNQILFVMIGLYLVFGSDGKNSDNNTQLQQSC